MPRILTVTDDDLNIEARIHIEKADPGTEPQIMKLELSSLGGRGIRSADLLILQELGLPLPQDSEAWPPLPSAAPAPALGHVPHQRDGGQARKPPKPKLPHRVGKGGRTYYEWPHPQELLAVYTELGCSPAKMAHHYGVETHLISNLLARLRKQGHDFPYGHRATSDSQTTVPLPPPDSSEAPDAPQQS